MGFDSTENMDGIPEIDDVEVITVVVRDGVTEVDAGGMSEERAVYLLFQAAVQHVILDMTCEYCDGEEDVDEDDDDEGTS